MGCLRTQFLDPICSLFLVIIKNGIEPISRIFGEICLFFQRYSKEFATGNLKRLPYNWKMDLSMDDQGKSNPRE